MDRLLVLRKIFCTKITNLTPNTSYHKRKTIGHKEQGEKINVKQNPSLFPKEQFKARILLEENLNKLSV